MGRGGSSERGGPPGMRGAGGRGAIGGRGGRGRGRGEPGFYQRSNSGYDDPTGRGDLFRGRGGRDG